jgi:NDP-sugar pyrophosphorylase family protein
MSITREPSDSRPAATGPLRAVIMAGGSGVRLRPLTYAVPKPLLPIGRYTVIEYSIKRLAASGVREIFVVTHYHSDKFAVCLEYGDRYGVDIELVREECQMGTIGGIYPLRDRLDGSFLMLNGDLVTSIDYADLYRFHRETGAVFSVVSHDYVAQVPYGVLSIGADSSLSAIVEKPAHTVPINAGIYVAEPDVFTMMGGQRLDVPHLLDALIARNRRVSVYRHAHKWLDIGHSQDYEQAIDILAQWENGNG